MPNTIDLNNTSVLTTKNDEKVKVAGQNLVNTRNPDYTRKEVDSDGIIVRSNQDYQVFLKRFAAASDYFGPAVAEDVLKSLDGLFNPIKDTSLSLLQTSFEATLQSLVQQPTSDTCKNQAFDALNNLVRGVKVAGEELMSAKYANVSRMQSSVDTANVLLQDLAQVNKNIALVSQSAKGGERAHFQDRQDALLKQLSEHLLLKVVKNSKGQALISLSNQDQLLSEDGHVTLICEQVDDTEAGVRILLESNKRNRSEVTDNVKGGRLGGLIKSNKEHLPGLIKKIDNYASSLAQTVNKAFNTGVSPTAQYSYKAANAFKGNAQLDFQGKTSFCIVERDKGGAISSSRNANEYFSPMDFASSDGLSMRQMIDQFNQRFSVDPAFDRTQLGDISDVKLHVSKDGKLNLALLNEGHFDAKVQVVSVTIAVAAPIDCGATVEVKSGQYLVTKDLFKDSPVDIKVKTGDDVKILLRSISQSNLSEGEIGFSIAGLGKYVKAQNILATVVVPGITFPKTVPRTGSSRASMRLVDKDGSDIVDDDTEGYLQIQGYGLNAVAFGDEIDPSSSKLGLGATLGLNNLISGSTSSSLALSSNLASSKDLPISSLKLSDVKALAKINNGEKASVTLIFDFLGGNKITQGNYLKIALYDINYAVSKFNFVAPNDIASLDDLVKALEGDAIMKEMFDFEALNLQLKISVKVPGKSFNGNTNTGMWFSSDIDKNVLTHVKGQAFDNIKYYELEGGTDVFGNKEVSAGAYVLQGAGVIENLQALLKAPNMVYNEEGYLQNASLAVLKTSIVQDFSSTLSNAVNVAQEMEESLNEVTRLLQKESGSDELAEIRQLDSFALQQQITLYFYQTLYRMKMKRIEIETNMR